MIEGFIANFYVPCVPLGSGEVPEDNGTYCPVCGAHNHAVRVAEEEDKRATYSFCMSCGSSYSAFIFEYRGKRREEIVK